MLFIKINNYEKISTFQINYIIHEHEYTDIKAIKKIARSIQQIDCRAVPYAHSILYSSCHTRPCTFLIVKLTKTRRFLQK